MNKTIEYSDEDDAVLTQGINYLTGFIDLLWNSLSFDGFEAVDPNGLQAITDEAREKLKAVKSICSRLMD